MTRIPSVFDDLTDSPAEAENLRVRAKLMRGIRKLIRSEEWSQKEAAAHCGVTVPRLNALLNGHIDKFSIDALVKVAARLGQSVTVEMSTHRDAA